ncbi:MAG TPA: hypothetical protein VHX18_00775, partial [Rhizomicrobium sp.]|nr:hypothetical protein [Rhizomicrobium sp.]
AMPRCFASPALSAPRSCVNQQRLVDLLIRVTDGSVNRAPGFISSTLHRSIDGTKVTMYAQWRCQEMRQNPGPLPFLQEALTFATFEPGMYEMVRTFHPAQ